MEAEVCRLLPHRACGHNYLRTEHFKHWWREAYHWDQSKNPPQMDRWRCLVEILHHMWRTGAIPQDLGWTFLVLIPKGTTNTWGIGLLETLLKVVEALIYT